MLVRSALLILATVAGCGRLHFDLRLDSSPDTTGAAVIDTASITCDWSSGPSFASAPVLVSALSTGVGEYDPGLVPDDPYTMYFASERDGTIDVFTAKRAMLDTAWDTPMKVTELSGAANDAALVLEPGGLHGYFASNSAGNNDLYEVERPTLSDPFAIVRPLTELNTADVELDPWPAADGRALYFVRGATTAALDMFVATRPDRTAMWGTPVPLPFNTGAKDSQASLTADERVIVWSRRDATDENLYYATRSSATDAFGPPQMLSISSADNDSEPYVRADGCELHYVRGAGPGITWDIYQVAIQPL